MALPDGMMAMSRIFWVLYLSLLVATLVYYVGSLPPKFIGLLVSGVYCAALSLGLMLAIYALEEAIRNCKSRLLRAMFLRLFKPIFFLARLVAGFQYFLSYLPLAMVLAFLPNALLGWELQGMLLVLMFQLLVAWARYLRLLRILRTERPRRVLRVDGIRVRRGTASQLWRVLDFAAAELGTVAPVNLVISAGCHNFFTVSDVELNGRVIKGPVMVLSIPILKHLSLPDLHFLVLQEMRYGVAMLKNFGRNGTWPLEETQKACQEIGIQSTSAFDSNILAFELSNSCYTRIMDAYLVLAYRVLLDIEMESQLHTAERLGGIKAKDSLVVIHWLAEAYSSAYRAAAIKDGGGAVTYGSVTREYDEILAKCERIELFSDVLSLRLSHPQGYRQNLKQRLRWLYRDFRAARPHRTSIQKTETTAGSTVAELIPCMRELEDKVLKVEPWDTLCKC